MKKLVIEAKTVKGWGVLLRIKEQICRGIDFGTSYWNGENCAFKASNGLMLISSNQPEIRSRENKLFVRGRNREYDNHILFVDSPNFIRQLREAVREYNDFFNDEKKESEDSEGVEIIQ